MSCSIFPANAPVGADVTLVLELAMGAALLFGAWLARQGQYRLHAWCQSCVVLLNLVVVSFAMAASFGERVLPKIPERLGRSFYGIATAHATVGVVAQVATIYVLIAAGTRWLPERWRLRNFRTTMRGVLLLWWVAIILGCATYVRWYAQM